MLCLTILNLEMRWLQPWRLDSNLACHTIQIKATKHYFSVVLFIMLHQVILTFESVDEIPKCDHSKKAPERYFPVVAFITLYKVIFTLVQRSQCFSNSNKTKIDMKH